MPEHANKPSSDLHAEKGAAPENRQIMRQQARSPINPDPIALTRWVLRRWYFILLFAVLGAVAAGAYTKYMIRPVYESTAKLYIVAASGDSVVNLTDLNLGTSLTNDYKELLLNYPVLDQVISALNLEMSSDALRGMISLSTPANTRVLSINVRSHDPELSKNIANTLAGVARTYLPETMSTPMPNVAQVARAAKGPSSPSMSRNVMMGGLVGALLVIAYLALTFMLNDAVQSQEDLENTFGLTVLAVVPDFSQHKAGKDSYGYYGYGKKKSA